MTRQLYLPIRLRDSASLNNYVVGRNEEAFSALNQWLKTSITPPVLFLYGVSGSGCSHLLQATCRFLSDNNEASLYVPAGDPTVSRELISQLNPNSTVCIDDIGEVAGDLDWEESILEVYERFLVGDGRLLFSASRPPLALGLRLPDLATRLAAGAVYRIQALTEQELSRAVQLRAYQRGLELSDDVIQYLFRRIPRNSKAIFDLLDRVDEAAYVKKRRLTIPFIREIEKEYNGFN